jgi:hypothetical protein
MHGDRVSDHGRMRQLDALNDRIEFHHVSQRVGPDERSVESARGASAERIG